MPSLKLVSLELCVNTILYISSNELNCISSFLNKCCPFCILQRGNSFVFYILMWFISHLLCEPKIVQPKHMQSLSLNFVLKFFGFFLPSLSNFAIDISFSFLIVFLFIIYSSFCLWSIIRHTQNKKYIYDLKKLTEKINWIQ